MNCSIVETSRLPAAVFVNARPLYSASLPNSPPMAVAVAQLDFRAKFSHSPNHQPLNRLIQFGG
jgi:hypothetical protein